MIGSGGGGGGGGELPNVNCDFIFKALHEK